MSEKEAFGLVYRKLRCDAGDTLQDVAGKLARLGLDITTRSAVSRLEERGSTDLLVIRAYGQIYKISQAKMERMVQSFRSASESSLLTAA